MGIRFLSIKKKGGLPLLRDDTVKALINALQDKLAEEIAIIDLSSESSFADAFILATGNSDVHMKTLLDNVSETMDRMERDYSIEGERSPKWILLDAGNVVINIFSREGRDFYRLESIWANAEMTHIGD